jgi:hypothetical protein
MNPPASAEQKFWSLLTTTKVPVEGRQLGRIKVLGNKVKSLYLIELMIADTLATMDDNCTWYLTGVGADKGVDFEARTDLVKVNLFKLEISTAVIGQIKRMKHFDIDKVRAALTKIEDHRRTRNVSSAMLVLSSETRDFDKIKQAVEDRTLSGFDGERHVLSIEEFFLLWANHPSYLRAIFERAHLSEDSTAFLFEQLVEKGRKLRAADGAGTIRMHASPPPAAVDCGVPFRVTVKVEFPHFLSLQTVHLKHEPSPECAGRISTLRPSRVRSENGTSFRFREAKEAGVDLWLRAEAPGRIELGRLFAWGPGEVASPVICDLGVVHATPRYSPAYFPEPNLPVAKRLNSLLKRAHGGMVTAALVVGAGGAGKTELCEALIGEATDDGFRAIRLTVSDTADPRADIVTLIHGLFGAHRGLGVPGRAEVLEVIRTLLGPMADVLNQLDLCLSGAGESLNARDLSIGLCALAVRTLTDRPLVIHLQNMHWAGKPFLDTLDLFMAGLRDAETSGGSHQDKRLPNGVFLLFEGRIGEARRLDGEMINIQPWLDFRETVKVEEFALGPWSPTHSRRFTERQLQFQAPGEGTIGRELHQEVIAYVERRAKGSPMHIVEQIRLLFDEGTLAHADDGRVEVRKSLRGYRPVPDDVDEVIRDRWRFLQARAPSVALVLVLLAKTGSANDRGYVEQLLAACSPPLSAVDLERTGCIRVPADSETAFEFTHENYVQVFQTFAVDGRSSLLACAIEWHKANSKNSNRTQLHLAKLLTLSWRPPYATVVRLGKSVLLKEGTSPGDKETALRGLLRVPRQHLEAASLSPEDLRYQLALLLEGGASWEEALLELDRLACQCESVKGESSARLVLAKALAEKANVLVDLQRTEEALAAVDAGMKVVLELRDHGAAESSMQLSWIEEKLLHRQAVALWFDGRQREAMVLQRRSGKKARARGDWASLAVILREFGTLCLHDDIGRGLRLLQLAKALGDAHKETVSLVDRRVTEVQYLLAQVMRGTAWGGDQAQLDAVCIDAMKLHDACLKEGFGYEPALSSLVAGVAAAVMHDDQRAHRLFRLAVIHATQGRLANLIWQTRLNLAQMELRLGNRGAARQNAREAAAFIGLGFEGGAPSRSRLRLMELPLRQAVRCGLEPWRPDGSLADGPGEGETVTPLYCKSGEDCFFLMS